MRRRIVSAAQRQAERLDRWWVENRPAAATLFSDELHRTLELITERPGVGVRWPTPRRPELRRILMSETQNHVYYVVDEPRETIVVVAIWGAARGRGPRV